LTAPAAPAKPLFGSYRPLADAFDEFFTGDGAPRAEVEHVVSLLDRLGRDEFRVRMKLAEGVFLKQGVTFSVYGDEQGAERVFPFDLVPRTIGAGEWQQLQLGLEQRVRALNAFLSDIYGRQRILRDRVIPRRLVEGSRGWLREACGVRPAGDTYIHVAGIDLVRRPGGAFAVLEDNVRTPSGVSYVLENRSVMKRVFPRVFQHARVRAVDEYPGRLKEALLSLHAERSGGRLVILSPGPYNSAYFEHAFLARRMGCELAQGQDLFVERDHLYLKTTRGPERVDVIYRRIDDRFLDPETFNPDSALGVPGLWRAYAAGTVTIANAIGNGVADDKAVYPYVPKMIRYYLSEEPNLGQVETFLCSRPSERAHVLANLAQLVVKATDEAGGYGMLVGPRSTRKERTEMAERIKASPRQYIAQPLLELSTCPAWVQRGVAPRRVDLRPYVVTGRETWVLPGGLTRVALRRGSYVVNSSQGGGSKDTWVLDERS
jgi:uncharacterized circularly permuted ATP-grasp superfamily protein